jgi:hypothetical protein
MSFIILFMATSFSAKNGASSLTPESIVVQMSDTEREMSWAEATNAVAAANPSVITGKTARISELIRNSLKTRWSAVSALSCQTVRPPNRSSELGGDNGEGSSPEEAAPPMVDFFR